LTKSPKYYFDHHAIKLPLKDSSFERMSQDVANQKGSYRVPGKTNGPMKAKSAFVSGQKQKNLIVPGVKNHTFHMTRNSNGNEWAGATLLANRRSVWTVTTQPSKELHFAMFPLEIPTLCIKAGSKPGDLVLDPFAGGGTTLLAASKLGRTYIGFEINEKYARIAKRRLRQWEGLFYNEL